MKDNAMGISFEEVKQIFQESIDDSANINELLQSVADKIYKKGLNDGIAPMKGRRQRVNCENCKHYYEDQSEYHWCHMCHMEESCYVPIEKDGKQEKYRLIK